MKHLCEAPTAELCSRHKCPKCKQIVHIVCGVFDEDTDEYVCKRCFGSPVQGHGNGASSTSAATRVLDVTTPASKAQGGGSSGAAKAKERKGTGGKSTKAPLSEKKKAKKKLGTSVPCLWWHRQPEEDVKEVQVL